MTSQPKKKLTTTQRSTAQASAQGDRMRELPEIEVLRRDLERELAGRKVRSVQVAGAVIKDASAFVAALTGASVVSVARRGLALVITLDGDRALVVRVGATGLVQRGVDPSPADVSLTFTAGPPLRFTGFSGNASMDVVAAEDLDSAVPERRSTGFDPLDEPMTWVRFSTKLGARQVPLRRVLLDSTFVLGLGDVYIDEVLFEAGVRHDRRADSLSSQEVRRLYRSLIEVLHDAVKHRGTSLGDVAFLDIAGKQGEHQQHLQVHGREGHRSPRSRTPIRRASFEGRRVYYCDTQV